MEIHVDETNGQAVQTATAVAVELIENSAPPTPAITEPEDALPLWDFDGSFNSEEGRQKLFDWMDANPLVAKTSREFAIDVVFGVDVFISFGGANGRKFQHQVKDALDYLAGKRSGRFDASIAKINRMPINQRVFFQALEGRVLTTEVAR